MICRFYFAIILDLSAKVWDLLAENRLGTLPRPVPIIWRLLFCSGSRVSVLTVPRNPRSQPRGPLVGPLGTPWAPQGGPFGHPMGPPFPK